MLAPLLKSRSRFPVNGCKYGTDANSFPKRSRFSSPKPKDSKCPFSVLEVVP